MKKSLKKQKPSMRDVARLAGVNRVTASVALNGSLRTGTRVSDATRLRVVAAAKELGYTPNAIALALRGQRTNIIGYFSGYEFLDAHDPFNAVILNGLQRSCHMHRQDLLIFGSYQRNSVEEVYASLVNGKIDGLVLLPTSHSPVLDQLLQSHLPIVAVANPVPNIASVTVDDLTGSRLLAEYLVQKGHQRILYRADAAEHTSTRRRLKAFLGLAPSIGLNVQVSHGESSGQLRPEEVTILTAPPDVRPTAIVSWADSHAYVLLESLRALGIRVPDDFSIVGFDGVPLRIRPAYTLTTIRAPWEQVAATAVDLLMDLIEGGKVAQETMLPVELVAGDTA
jgi:DNA-binding LacI/PurR family transcriptional regulator